MSIINDALKKAQEKNKAEDIVTGPAPIAQPASPPTPAHRQSYKAPADAKRLIPALISLIVIATGVVFFRSFSRKTAPDAGLFLAPASPIAEPVSPAVSAPAVPMPAPLNAQGFPVLKLNGIVYDSERPYAIVNNKVLSKGDAVEGATLTEIEQEKVKFVFNGREFELSSR
jgi:hypothetical protein